MMKNEIQNGGYAKEWEQYIYSFSCSTTLKCNKFPNDEAVQVLAPYGRREPQIKRVGNA